MPQRQIASKSELTAIDWGRGSTAMTGEQDRVPEPGHDQVMADFAKADSGRGQLH
jgi:hypothetical protein